MLSCVTLWMCTLLETNNVFFWLQAEATSNAGTKRDGAEVQIEAEVQSEWEVQIEVEVQGGWSGDPR